MEESSGACGEEAVDVWEAQEAEGHRKSVELSVVRSSEQQGVDKVLLKCRMVIRVGSCVVEMMVVDEEADGTERSTCTVVGR